MVWGSGWNSAGGGGGGSTPTLPTLTLANNGLVTAEAAITSGTTNAKGSPISLGNLTSAIDRLDLRISGTSGRRFRFDLFSGASLIAADVPVNQNGPLVVQMSLPIRIPAGALTMQVAASVNNATIYALPYGYTSTPQQTASLVEPIGTVNTAATAAGAVQQGSTGIGVTNAAGSPVQIGSALVNAIAGLLVHVDNDNDPSRTATRYTVEIGTGPNVGAITWLPLPIMVESSGTGIPMERIAPIFQAFPAGTIFWTRAQSVAATADMINVQLHGIR
jgi:hypothetical protein